MRRSIRGASCMAYKDRCNGDGSSRLADVSGFGTAGGYGIKSRVAEGYGTRDTESCIRYTSFPGFAMKRLKEGFHEWTR